MDEENAQMDGSSAARHRSREVDEWEERRTVVRDAVGLSSLEEREQRDGRSLSFTGESDVSPEFIVTSIQRGSRCLLLCDI